jgi:hypothetical protein
MGSKLIVGFYKYEMGEKLKGFFFLACWGLLREISLSIISQCVWILSSSSFIHSSMALQPFVGPWHLLQCPNVFSPPQSVGLLGRVISPSQGRHLHAG